MNRTDITLAALASSDGEVFTPVQIQKLLFLLDKKIPGEIGGPHFNFRAYDYGPFDATVYHEIEALEAQGLAEVVKDESIRWSKYSATPRGVQRGRKILASFDHAVSDYIRALSTFVRGVSFETLVSTIYKEYPEMKKNSVFRG